MVALPSLLFLTAAVLLGIYLGFLYLRRERPKRLLLAGHIVMGLVGVEQLALLIRGTPSGVVTSETLVKAAAGLLALATFAAFTAPLLAQYTRRQNGEVMLAAHVSLGIIGFGLFLFWLLNVPNFAG